MNRKAAGGPKYTTYTSPTRPVIHCCALPVRSVAQLTLSRNLLAKPRNPLGALGGRWGAPGSAGILACFPQLALLPRSARVKNQSAVPFLFCRFLLMLLSGLAPSDG